MLFRKPNGLETALIGGYCQFEKNRVAAFKIDARRQNSLMSKLGDPPQEFSGPEIAPTGCRFGT
jgi:hypothetical protein